MRRIPPARVALTAAFILCFVIAGLAIRTQKTLKVDVDMVLVYATVTDELGHYVLGLAPEHFQVFEDKVEQKVQTFSSEDVPMSVGIILDASGSMKSSITLAKDAAVTFLKIGSPEDDYFLVEFNDKAVVTEDFTTDISRLQNHLMFIPAKGRTALFDSLYLGLEKVREGTNPRKFLLIITDGGDNHSRYSFAAVRDFARERDAQIYLIAVTGGGGPIGSGTVSDIVELTGGRRFFARSADDLDDICTKIAIEVKSQYIIGYRSTNENHDGKYRRVAVKVNPPKGLSRMFVRAKEGYYAPAQ